LADGLARGQTHLYYSASDVVLGAGYRVLEGGESAVGFTGMPSGAAGRFAQHDVSPHFRLNVHNGYAEAFGQLAYGAANRLTSKEGRAMPPDWGRAAAPNGLTPEAVAAVAELMRQELRWQGVWPQQWATGGGGPSEAQLRDDLQVAQLELQSLRRESALQECPASSVAKASADEDEDEGEGKAGVEGGARSLPPLHRTRL
jgi:hypothetical protein